MKAVRTFPRLLILTVFFMGVSTSLGAQDPAPEKSTESILEEFVRGYKTDPMAMDANFGVRVGAQWWHVEVRRVEVPYAVGKSQQYTFHEYGPHNVTLYQGPPPEPTWYFRFSDRKTLERIYDKSLSASTAAAKSTPADIVSFDIEDMEGFESDQGDTALAYLTMEHFWKKEAVEVTRFSRDSSLPSHGASIVSLYTMKDKRIGWFSLGQEEAANADRGLDKSQVPNLFIITKGKGKGHIGDEVLDLEPGMSVFVGPYVKHIIYNPNPEPLEGILILYGDNIDYAEGQSYMSFLENEYAFYSKNEKEMKDAAAGQAKASIPRSGGRK
jgi:mannose-6-phosphate isomerase-like protein (cupin superfamily)